MEPMKAALGSRALVSTENGHVMMLSWCPDEGALARLGDSSAIRLEQKSLGQDAWAGDYFLRFNPSRDGTHVATAKGRP